MNRSSFRRARKTVDVSVGESVRIIRDLHELSQNGLAELTGIPWGSIFGVEAYTERTKILVAAATQDPL